LGCLKGHFHIKLKMTAEEVVTEGCSIPVEGEDITPNKDGGVLKVNIAVH